MAMAIYDYVCPKDGTKRSVSQTISEYDPSKMVRCPECRSKMRRNWSPPSISIK